jgi:hypothetical protein
LYLLNRVSDSSLVGFPQLQRICTNSSFLLSYKSGDDSDDRSNDDKSNDCLVKALPKSLQTLELVRCNDGDKDGDKDVLKHVRQPLDQKYLVPHLENITVEFGAEEDVVPSGVV